MDFLFICPVLLALLLSRGSFADLEKQRVDSGLEICILLCSLPLVSWRTHPHPLRLEGARAQGKRQRPWKGAQGGGRGRTQNCWAVASLLFCRRVLAELPGLLTKRPAR